MNLLTKLLLSFSILSVSDADAGQLWHNVTAQKGKTEIIDNHQALLYQLNETQLKALLIEAEGEQQVIDLPLPDGSIRSFRIWESSILPATLSAKYPEIKTYTAEALNNPRITAKIDFTPAGFHAMIFDGVNTSFIDPISTISNATYKVKYKRDEPLRDRNGCQTVPSPTYSHTDKTPYAAKTIGGYQLRKYRLAISCDHQYAEACVGTAILTKARVLGSIVTTMNRINGVYERELSITMTLVNHEDTLLFIDAATDPFGSNDSNPVGLMDQNQHFCDSLIGTANYDIGHIFSTGAGGLSQIGCVCDPTSKAKSVTGNASPTGDGFDIDYVAHEMGHEFGANHSFNNNTSGSCYSNANPETAYEPGSGSTIMAYAGICFGDNVQAHSDAYFTTASLVEIYNFVTTTGNTCATKTATGNKPPALTSFTSSYKIPYLTPFELTAPQAIDSVADTSTTYCWEQWNLGDFGKALKNTELNGPLFRSYTPDTNRTRIFPKNSMVLTGLKSDAGTDFAEGNKLPTVARSMNFRLTVRNIYQGNGCFLFPDDSIHLDAINTGTGFEVTSQNTVGLKYIGGSQQTIKWLVANTDISPINTTEVDIFLSLDGGNTWGTYLGRFPNSGSAVVTLPNPSVATSAARVKVKGVNNVFFNVNLTDFSLISNPGIYGDILLFPIPAKDVITIVSGDKGTISGGIYCADGKRVWEGEISSILDIDVSKWPRALYIVKMVDIKNKVTIKKFVLQ